MVNSFKSGTRSVSRVPGRAGFFAAAFLVTPIAAAEAPSFVRHPDPTISGKDTPVIQPVAVIDAGSMSDHAIIQRLLGQLDATDGTEEKAAADAANVPLRPNAVAERDPYFERWQKDANERLKQENAISTEPAHPLAVAHPGQSVVVCEAGCGATKVQIVYIAAPYSAVSEATTVIPSPAHSLLSGGTSSVIGARPEPVEDGGVPCMAGCYGPQQSSLTSAAKTGDPALENSSAAAEPGYRVSQFAVHRHLRISNARAQIAFNGAIVGPTHLSRVTVKRLPFAKVAFAKGKAKQSLRFNQWRTIVNKAAAATRSHLHTANVIKASKRPAWGILKVSRVAVR